MRAGEAGLRYASALHHPALPTFPHHNHAGKERSPATEPTPGQVRHEVAPRLGEKERRKGRRHETSLFLQPDVAHDYAERWSSGQRSIGGE
ncbi:MAG: DUF6516 family protein [Thermodesulfobacteriota bacterium]